MGCDCLLEQVYNRRLDSQELVTTIRTFAINAKLEPPQAFEFVVRPNDPSRNAYVLAGQCWSSPEECLRQARTATCQGVGCEPSELHLQARVHGPYWQTFSVPARAAESSASPSPSLPTTQQPAPGPHPLPVAMNPLAKVVRVWYKEPPSCHEPVCLRLVSEKPLTLALHAGPCHGGEVDAASAR